MSRRSRRSSGRNAGADVLRFSPLPGLGPAREAGRSDRIRSQPRRWRDYSPDGGALGCGNPRRLSDARMSTEQAPLAAGFREAMRRVASTVNVISICVDGQPLGITATAVSSLSMDPPSLLVCINRAAAVHASMADLANFRVNILHRDQEDIARMFADRREEERRFADGWELSS